MTSNTLGDEETSDKESENPSPDENQSPEDSANASVAAGVEADKTDEVVQSADDAGVDAGVNGGSDPLGFDDARMPEDEHEGVDLSANESESGDQGGEQGGAESDGEPDGEPDLETQLATANAKVDEHWARILRMQADLENERKRTQKQVSSAHKFAIEKFAEELLPIKDSLEMGLDAAKADDADLSKIVEGSELTLKLLSQAFEKNQIVEVDPMDDKFDPNVHQAMSMQEVEGKEANTVIGVMQKGYTLNDRLIRPALVTVSK